MYVWGLLFGFVVGGGVELDEIENGKVCFACVFIFLSSCFTMCLLYLLVEL